MRTHSFAQRTPRDQTTCLARPHPGRRPGDTDPDDPLPAAADGPNRSSTAPSTPAPLRGGAPATPRRRRRTGGSARPPRRDRQPVGRIIGQDNVAAVKGESYNARFFGHRHHPVTVRAHIQLPVDRLHPVALGGTPGSPRPADATATRSPRRSTAERAGRVPARRQRRPPGRSASTTSRSRAAPSAARLPAGHRPAGAGQPGRLPARRPEERHPRHRRRPTPLPWQLQERGRHGRRLAARPRRAASTPTLRPERAHASTSARSRAPGTGYTLVADGETSRPFDIDAEPLRAAARRRAEVLLHPAQRHRDPRRPRARLRPARRPRRRRPQPGRHRRAVPARRLRLHASTCSGGWYDAGDHGKYVVNGGISVAPAAERLRARPGRPTGDRAALGDGTLRIPERGNRVPDVLDEARWELEFLLQHAGAGRQAAAGMAHHKVHDADWTGLPLLPGRRPAAARAAPALDRRHAQPGRHRGPGRPALRAVRHGVRGPAARPPRDGLRRGARPTRPATRRPADGTGGGAYDDDNVTDEFYWAAAELYITTGEKAYQRRRARLAAAHRDVFRAGGLRLGHTAAARPARPGDRAQRAARTGRGSAQSVVDGADKYLADQAASPYGHAVRAGQRTFDWGSNSLVLNNMVVIATAYDLTGDAEVPRRRAAGHGLPPRPQRAEPVLRDRLRRASLAEPAQPAGTPTSSTRRCRNPPAGIAGRRPELGASRTRSRQAMLHAAASRSSATSTTSSRGRPTR